MTKRCNRCGRERTDTEPANPCITLEDDLTFRSCCRECDYPQCKAEKTCIYCKLPVTNPAAVLHAVGAPIIGVVCDDCMKMW